MKKSLVALAALAATAAFAQSSVTLYGIADAYVGSEKTAGVTQTVVNSGGLSDSRIGLSVKEDLGAGLQGFVVIENGFDISNGAGGGVRKSVLGLTGSFGTVGLGAQQSPLSQVVENVIDAQSDSVFSSVRGVQGGSTFRTISNSVRYDTPNFDGFNAAVQVGLGENKVAGAAPAAVRATRDTAFSVGYANGPLAVALAHEIAESQVAALPNNLVDKVTATVLGGAYDFGVVKLNLGFGNTKQSRLSGNDKALSIGLTAPVGAFTVVGQLSRAKATNQFAAANFTGANNVNGTSNRTSAGLEGRYALSKRTTSYVGFNQTKDGNQASATDTSRVFGVGVRHVF